MIYIIKYSKYISARSQHLQVTFIQNQQHILRLSLDNPTSSWKKVEANKLYKFICYRNKYIFGITPDNNDRGDFYDDFRRDLRIMLGK